MEGAMAAQRGARCRWQPPPRSLWRCRARVALGCLAAPACVLAALSGAGCPRAACSPPAGGEGPPLGGAARPEAAGRRWRLRWAETLRQWTEAVVEGGALPDGDFAQAAAEACHEGGRGCWQQALGVLRTLVLEDLSPRIEIHNAVIGACARAVKWSHALGVLHDMSWNELEPDAVSFLRAMQAVDEAQRRFLAKDEVRGALELLLAKSLASLERDPQPRMALYRTALRSCLHLSHRESALRLLGQLRSAGGAEGYRAAAEVSRECGQPQQTMELLKETLTLQLPPDAVAYDAYIEACTELSSYPVAIPELLKQSVDAVLATCGTGPPDVAAFSAAMRSCGRCRQWDRALSLLAELARRGGDADARAFDAAIWACARGRQTVLPLLEEMQEWRLQPSAASVASAMCEHVVNNDTSSARAVYRSSLQNSLSRTDLGARWLTSPVSADLSALSAEAAAEAARFLAEDLRRKKQWAPGKVVVITTGSGAGSGDVRGARKKRLVDAVLSHEYGVAADSSRNGFITIPAQELRSMMERFRGVEKKKKKKRRRRRRMLQPEAFAFQGWEDGAEAEP